MSTENNMDFAVKIWILHSYDLIQLILLKMLNMFVNLNFLYLSKHCCKKICIEDLDFAMKILILH